MKYFGHIFLVENSLKNSPKKGKRYLKSPINLFMGIPFRNNSDETAPLLFKLIKITNICCYTTKIRTESGNVRLKISLIIKNVFELSAKAHLLCHIETL